MCHLWLDPPIEGTNLLFGFPIPRICSEVPRYYTNHLLNIVQQLKFHTLPKMKLCERSELSVP
jgi:hypothetical protein